MDRATREERTEAAVPNVFAGDEEDVETANVPKTLREITHEEVAQFITSLHESIMAEDVDRIRSLYERHYRRLSDKYFKEKTWPEPQKVAKIIDEGLFQILYRELFYRHIFIKLRKPVLADRHSAYENYISLFTFILDADAPVPFELPDQWLWDIIDEFVYQFEGFVQHKGYKAHKQAYPEDWDVKVVFNVLHQLITRSRINEQLEAFQRGDNPADVADEFGNHPLYRMLGYFSLVGSLRLHTLMGDYRQALEAVRNIDLSKPKLISNVLTCQVTIYHQVGFCYLMSRRYHDAIGRFEDILYYTRSTDTQNMYYSDYHTIRSKCEHITALLALAHAMEDGAVKDMYRAESENLRKAADGDEEAAAALFKKGAPKFVEPSVMFASLDGSDEVADAASDDTASSSSKLATDTQLQVFLRDFRRRKNMVNIRSYLKLYESLKISKLASLLGKDEDELRLHLHAHKRRTNQLVWSAGKQPLAGTRQCADTLDFYIDGDTIHVASITVSQGHGEKLLQATQRLMQDPRKEATRFLRTRK
ncbi:hypothetical protein PTSG_10220 [Salpingoeca rosetta]|uniref:Eukaryotic translation initiation factor 3 subunit L n=1 Tax=Salpingoeca rosetta (strain ATCC 50818 / BSB-021) TaxID=946362 RepID=F2UQN3_SALR5|nr:uncharacterized protein PTSG_10220 [Salpingoeca rosetta]EGD79938.1 hypothetical protein PTSG_10220 [Salpingoeca rosetta]|eukprot:XP_004988559.1 hypothetical protein PTSG_10220 [Salpingoeca rosetta]